MEAMLPITRPGKNASTIGLVPGEAYPMAYAAILWKILGDREQGKREKKRFIADHAMR